MLHMPNSTSQQERWRNLLLWLGDLGMKVGPEELYVQCKARPGAGNGLFATSPCPPSTPLFTVPATALVNIKTLAPHYPSRPSLTATQLISLHLLLHRPGDDGISSDPLFGPYISTLPREFDSHPLTWLVKLRTRTTRTEAGLLDSLTPGVRNALQKVGERFWKDWQRVHEFVEEHPDIIKKIQELRLTTTPIEARYTMLTVEFLWSWLNVNTRCIYWRLKTSRSDPDNLTLCPILDFANHTPFSSQMFPQSSDVTIWNTTPRPKLGDDFTLLSSHNTDIHIGEEICLTYGAHSNRTLFVEYGFINEMFDGELDSNFSGEVDVQDIIEEMFRKRGIVGEWMKGILEQEGYWEDWTLHSYPTPASPSYRLITALRLYHVLPISVLTLPSFQANYALQLWRDTLAGKQEYVSKENENLWKGTLAEMCRMIVERAEDGLREIMTRSVDDNDGAWVQWMWGNIRGLWNEEIYVARAVAQSISQDIQFC